MFPLEQSMNELHIYKCSNQFRRKQKGVRWYRMASNQILMWGLTHKQVWLVLIRIIMRCYYESNDVSYITYKN
jgi:hypothetical protein